MPYFHSIFSYLAKPSQTIYTFFTAPSGPPSINNADDAGASAIACHQALFSYLNSHDGFLVACYSEHPLVKLLRERTPKPVVGIFEASISTSLNLLGDREKFGIVTTGKIWESLLTDGVQRFLAGGVNGDVMTLDPHYRFAGVKSTGLDATELHDAPVEEVKAKVHQATKTLVSQRSRSEVRAICLGCAGMVGMEEWVRNACYEELGPQESSNIKIVDGVKAGVGMLQLQIRANFSQHVVNPGITE